MERFRDGSIEEIDNAYLQEKIMRLSFEEWHKMVISKGTLWYKKKNTREMI
jgi:hypothetical protein